ncbi:cytochrome P450 [Marasmius fiardii PR-910]|nr:cytochrome P450 [Marasmius fiardii PR-910]
MLPQVNLTVVALAGILFLFLLITKIQRWRALSRYPGPFLAQWTSFYRAYYDIVVGGGWIEHLQDLHEIYGPVVRIGPNELHFSDPTAYADIYTSTPLHLKDPHMYDTFAIPPSSFSETDPREHNIVKSLTSAFFSRKAILGVEHIIQEQIDKLISQLLKYHRSTPADMDKAFRSATLDIITLYTFAYSIDAVSYPNFEHPVLVGIDRHVKKLWIFKHFPLLKHLLMSLPHSVVKTLVPSTRPALEFTGEMEKLVDYALEDPYRSAGEETRNVFYTLLNDGYGERKLKQSHKVTRKWLVGEGQVLRVAGSDTVGNTCMIGTRCILNDQRVLRRLVEELENAWPDKEECLSYERLEKLPYLTAVIKESLRMASSIVTPLARIVPLTGSMIAGHSVPPGTVVSIGNMFIHYSPQVFPDPKRFYPERWMQGDPHTLEKYLVAFGKGHRSCIGINLAWCELYLIFANVFRKLDLCATHDLNSKLRVLDYFVPFYEGEVLHVTANEHRS